MDIGGEMSTTFGLPTFTIEMKVATIWQSSSLSNANPSSSSVSSGAMSSS